VRLFSWLQSWHWQHSCPFSSYYCLIAWCLRNRTKQHYRDHRRQLHGHIALVTRRMPQHLFFSSSLQLLNLSPAELLNPLGPQIDVPATIIKWAVVIQIVIYLACGLRALLLYTANDFMTVVLHIVKEWLESMRTYKEDMSWLKKRGPDGQLRSPWIRTEVSRMNTK
jgi:hypothetical protein